MARKELLERKTQLEKQRKNAEVTFHQINGAIAMLDEQMAIEDADEKRKTRAKTVGLPETATIKEIEAKEKENKK